MPEAVIITISTVVGGILTLLIQRLIATPEQRAKEKSDALAILVREFADVKARLVLVEAKLEDCEERNDKMFEEVVQLRALVGGRRGSDGQ